jgi:hypothetical protein
MKVRIGAGVKERPAFLNKLSNELAWFFRIEKREISLRFEKTVLKPKLKVQKFGFRINKEKIQALGDYEDF